MTNYTIEQLEEMLKSTNIDTRKEVVKHGYGLDILINDIDEDVRAEVAKQGYGLDKLINDKDEDVRAEVAKQGYGLDKLINDANEDVRLEVAKQGYGLDKLVNDKDEDVLREVAKQGYGLNRLVSDENRYVSDIANKLIKYNNHKVITHNFGTYEGNLYLHYNNKNDYLIISGCYDSTDINKWKVKCEERINLETAEKYSELILKELNK